MTNEEEIEDPVLKLIDDGFNTFSWAFLPLILCAGIFLRTGGDFSTPIRVGAPKDPLSFAVPAASASVPTSALLLAASSIADPVYEDLVFDSAARGFSLPKSEQRREARLQELEDQRLERCRDGASKDFDQCFFFGSMESMGNVDARRAMEGGGILETGKSMIAQDARAAVRKGIPTW